MPILSLYCKLNQVWRESVVVVVKVMLFLIASEGILGSRTSRYECTCSIMHATATVNFYRFCMYFRQWMCIQPCYTNKVYHSHSPSSYDEPLSHRTHPENNIYNARYFIKDETGQS